MSDRETRATTRGRYLADEDPRADSEPPVAACEITGEDADECDCPDCYFARHEEPKPFGCCGGVGVHMDGCDS